MGHMHLHRFPWADLVLEEIHKFLRLARVNAIYKCLENQEKMLQEVKGSSRAWCLHSVPQKDGKMEKGRERAQRRDQSSRLSSPRYLHSRQWRGLSQSSQRRHPLFPRAACMKSHTCQREVIACSRGSRLKETVILRALKILLTQCLSSFAVSLQGSNPPALGFCSEPWLQKQLEDRWRSFPKHSPCCLCFPNQPLQDHELLPKWIWCLPTSQTPQILGEWIWKGGFHSYMCYVLSFSISLQPKHYTLKPDCSCFAFSQRLFSSPSHLQNVESRVPLLLIINEWGNENWICIYNICYSY